MAVTYEIQWRRFIRLGGGGGENRWRRGTRTDGGGQCEQVVAVGENRWRWLMRTGGGVGENTHHASPELESGSLQLAPVCLFQGGWDRGVLTPEVRPDCRKRRIRTAK